MRTDLKNIHIGELIKEKLHERGFTYAEFARKLNCDRTNVYNIVKSKSIDIERLIRISNILDFDFIKHYYYGNDDETTDVFIHDKNNISINVPFDMIKHVESKSNLNINIVFSENKTNDFS